MDTFSRGGNHKMRSGRLFDDEMRRRGEAKDINEDMILNIEVNDWRNSSVLDYMVTRGVSINAKKEDFWKLQLENV